MAIFHPPPKKKKQKNIHVSGCTSEAWNLVLGVINDDTTKINRKPFNFRLGPTGAQLGGGGLVVNFEVFQLDETLRPFYLLKCIINNILLFCRFLILVLWACSALSLREHYLKTQFPLCSRIRREPTHKKSVFLVVRPLRFYPPYIFFFSLIITWNGFWQYFLFLPNIWAKIAGF